MFKNSKEATANTNHKNRKYSILLLALLFIGVATYGTYAYFTDSKSIDGQLTLTKGQVSLGDADGSDWTYKGNSESTVTISDKSFTKYNANLMSGSKQVKVEGTGTSFSNVLPGDTFKKVVTVEYTGTVTATGTVTVDPTQLVGINYEVMATVGNTTYTIDENTSGDGTKSITTEDIKKGERVTITMIAQVPYNDYTEDFNTTTGTSRNNGNGKNFLKQLQDAITVSVAQQLTETTTSSN